jgi:hypothetical protein
MTVIICSITRHSPRVWPEASPSFALGFDQCHQYGYKIHAAVDVATDLPLAWSTETASTSEQTLALPLLDTVRERGFGLNLAKLATRLASERALAKLPRTSFA